MEGLHARLRRVFRELAFCRSQRREKGDELRHLRLRHGTNKNQRVAGPVLGHGAAREAHDRRELLDPEPSREFLFCVDVERCQ